MQDTKIKRVQVNVNFNVKVKCQGLSHLMRDASYPSFIGVVWSEAQQMRQKIWIGQSDTQKLIKKYSTFKR